MKNKDLLAEGEVKWSPGVLLENTLYRPFKMLTHEPILVLVTLYTSVVYAVLYACRFHLRHFTCVQFTTTISVFEAFPVIFIDNHGLSTSHCGLIFLGVGIGTTIGAVFNLWIGGARLGYNALIKKWRGFPPPELRLYGAATGGPLLVIGSFWLGWAGAYKEVPWYVAALSTIPLGMAICLIYISCLVCSCTATCMPVLTTTCILELPCRHISVSFARDLMLRLLISGRVECSPHLPSLPTR